MRAIRQLLTSRRWQPQDALELCERRLQQEQGAAPLNIKRGAGGTLDIEFVVQRLQLEHAGREPRVLEPNTLAAIAALSKAGALSQDDATWWSRAYRSLRRIEGGIRLLNSRDRHQLPAEGVDLHRLSLLLGYSSPQELCEFCQQLLAENRTRFLTAFADAMNLREQANEGNA